MAVTSSQVMSVGGVVLVLIGVMVYNALRAGKATRAAAGGPPGAGGVLQRYVHHGGAVVGQAVALEGGRVLLRQGGTHRAVPEAQLERAGDDLRLVGDVDWAAAEAEGAQWAKRLGGSGPGTE